MLKFKNIKNILLILPLFLFSIISMYGCNEQKFNISFYLDGAYLETQETSDYVNYPNFFVAEGNVIDGWYLDVNYSEKFHFSNKIMEDISLYARSLTYVEAFSKLVNQSGEEVSDHEVGVSNAGGLAIKLLGGTGVIKTNGYLINYNNSIYILEHNRVDKYNHYVFIWDLKTGQGSITIAEIDTYRVKFMASFNLSYEMDIKSIEDTIFYDTQVSTDYIYKNGIVKTKKAIQEYLTQLDELIRINF